MKTIAILARPKKDEAAQFAGQLIAHYKHLEVLVQSHVAEFLGCSSVSDAELVHRAEYAIVLGGDGTLIYGARLLKGCRIPILGINLGSLGFLTEIPIVDAITTIDAMLEGRARVDSRMKLSCRLFRDEGLILEDEVLNDVVINKSALARVADYQTWLDGTFTATYRADGIIVSTPTGSTAYSLSAGGPIVHPSMDCMVVTPICPHALTQRPIVVPGDQLVEVKLTEDISDVFLTIDGQAGQALKQGDRIEVQRSPHRVLLVRNPNLDTFSILRQKLRWGERGPYQ